MAPALLADRVSFFNSCWPTSPSSLAAAAGGLLRGRASVRLTECYAPVSSRRRTGPRVGAMMLSQELWWRWRTRCALTQNVMIFFCLSYSSGHSSVNMPDAPLPPSSSALVQVCDRLALLPSVTLSVSNLSGRPELLLRVRLKGRPQSHSCRVVLHCHHVQYRFQTLHLTKFLALFSASLLCPLL